MMKTSGSPHPQEPPGEWPYLKHPRLPGLGLPAQTRWKPFGSCGRGGVGKGDGMTQLAQKHLWSKDKASVGSALVSCLRWDVNRLPTGMFLTTPPLHPLPQY